MRIGINALYLLPGRVGGTEIYIRNLVRELVKIDSKKRVRHIRKQGKRGRIRRHRAVG